MIGLLRQATCITSVWGLPYSEKPASWLFCSRYHSQDLVNYDVFAGEGAINKAFRTCLSPIWHLCALKGRLPMIIIQCWVGVTRVMGSS